MTQGIGVATGIYVNPAYSDEFGRVVRRKSAADSDHQPVLDSDGKPAADSDGKPATGTPRHRRLITYSAGGVAVKLTGRLRSDSPRSVSW